MTPPTTSNTPDALVRRLREAGCVFAEDEATVLRASAVDAEHLEWLCARRISGAPLEHVVGWVAFGDLHLDVGPGAFVPRQRTLLLARVAVAAARVRGAPTVLEAYAGVAPVATTVRHSVPEARVLAAEIDPVAADYARRNLGTGAAVYRSDSFTAVPDALRGRIDVIAAVPPYVPTTAADLLPREALEHEPDRALFAGDDGLDHVRRLIDRSYDWLADGGVLAIEMNRNQWAAAGRHARRAGFTVRRRSDGHTSVLTATRPRGRRAGHRCR
ncbi:N5-glutamine methyltransferase family protein [Rhodococcus sp. SGAir0479]|uniref:N5-glutamine methyltransferase family protein n=1 Tax=Rhodococcus sp. SGAir0479 TaxID=2567884 RepID=UPI0010CD46EC|nr:SAM-dependent methyltransferase [Rhodococcus sp. SGAir0479]QCQ90040.1 SAM-dependent methyltransferase [Rhodococcus sp. SGAir0479]